MQCFTDIKNSAIQIVVLLLIRYTVQDVPIQPVLEQWFLSMICKAPSVVQLLEQKVEEPPWICK